jgi:hypothetical protein
MFKHYQELYTEAREMRARLFTYLLAAKAKTTSYVDRRASSWLATSPFHCDNYKEPGGR